MIKRPKYFIMIDCELEAVVGAGRMNYQDELIDEPDDCINVQPLFICVEHEEMSDCQIYVSKN